MMREVRGLFCLLLAGCSGGESLDPPQLLLGVDECVECRMIISDDRFAAAWVTRDQYGRLEKGGFDDLGCLLIYRRKRPESENLGEYVKDFETRAWLELATAHLIRSEKLHSPMAFGIAAFESAEKADALLAQHDGERLELSAIRSDPKPYLPDNTPQEE